MDIVYRLISIDRHKNTYGSDKLKCALPVFGDAIHPISGWIVANIVGCSARAEVLAVLDGSGYLPTYDTYGSSGIVVRT